MKRLTSIAAALCIAQAVCAAEPRRLPDPIVMMWQVAGEDPESDFKELLGLGVNTVQSFGLSRKPEEYVERYLAAAEASGMAVIPFVGDPPLNPHPICGLTEEGADFVRRHLASPAIVAWHTADEPSLRHVSRACQRQRYASVKALDPGRPVLVSTNFTKQAEYDEYFDEAAFDILDLHKYVNPHVAKSQRDLIAVFRKNRKKSYPVIMTFRAFNAPARPLRFDMREGDLRAQYRYFVEEAGITRNIGFYGWNLTKNLGIAQVPWMRREFETLMREKIRPVEQQRKPAAPPSHPCPPNSGRKAAGKAGRSRYNARRMQATPLAEKPRSNWSIAFLVYDARSGSTILSDILTRRLSRVYVTPEIAFTRLLKLAGRRGRMLPRTDLARKMMTDNLVRNLGIGPDDVERIVGGLPDRVGAADVIRTLLEAHLDAATADAPQCVIVKHGVHVRAWREIASAFGADTKLIHIYRDPRAVVNSKLRTTRPYVQHESQAWYGPLLAAWRWRSYSTAMREAKTSGVRMLDVNYETLLADPEAQARLIAGFLGVAMRGEDERPAADYRIPEAERGIHALVEGGRVYQERADAWASELAPRDLRTIEAVAAGEMRSRGYSPSREISSMRRLAVIVRELPRVATALVSHAWRQLIHRSANRSSACPPG